MARDNDPVECGEFEVVHATPDALLISDYCGTEIWIPKSKIDEESELDPDSKEGDEGMLILPEWLAIEKELV